LARTRVCAQPGVSGGRGELTPAQEEVAARERDVGGWAGQADRALREGVAGGSVEVGFCPGRARWS
jgi:hypothetical protein